MKFSIATATLAATLAVIATNPRALAFHCSGCMSIAKRDFSQVATQCYAQPAANDIRPSAAAPRPVDASRRLSDAGQVLHFSESGGGQIPRDEVVAAVRSAYGGGSDFEVQYVFDDILEIDDLIRDGMQLTEDGELDLTLTGSFTVKNQFLASEPGVLYEVRCPPASPEQEYCTVTITKTNSDGPALVSCTDEKSMLYAKNVPAACLDKLYDVSFQALEQGPHFFISAVIRDGDAGDRDACPRNVAFNSHEGKRWRSSIFVDDLEELPGHALGPAELGALFRAEEGVAPYSEQDYDLVTKNCAIYARDILRGAGLPETKELGQFIVDRLEKDPDTLEKLHLALAKGRFRALSSVLRVGSNKGLFEKVVYSQLDIKDDIKY